MSTIEEGGGALRWMKDVGRQEKEEWRNPTGRSLVVPNGSTDFWTCQRKDIPYKNVSVNRWYCI